MNRTRFIFEVKTEVEFSREEVDHLVDLSRQHYDHKVRSLVEYGGSLLGLKNRYLCGAACRVQLSTRDLDTLCKAAEGPAADHVLRGRLRDLLSDAQEKFRELNAEYLVEGT